MICPVSNSFNFFSTHKSSLYCTKKVLIVEAMTINCIQSLVLRISSFVLKNPWSYYLTLSLLGYLKTRIRLGGGRSIWPPPSKSHVWCPNMTNDTLLESSCALLLESAKKNSKFAKPDFFIAKSSYIVKMFAKFFFSKKWNIIHFWKALDHAISNMQIFLQNFK